MGFPGKNRRWKIPALAALVLLGVAVVLFFLAGDKGEVRVRFVSVSPTNPHCAVFAITNTTERYLRYGAYPAHVTNGVWRLREWTELESLGTLGPTSVTVFTMKVFSSTPWSTVVFHERSSSTNFVTATRQRLASVAENHRWLRVSRLLWRTPSPFKTTNGPEMRGNKPA